MHAVSIKALAQDAYKLPQGTLSIRLACGHEGLYVRPVPRPGEPAYCRQCREFTTRVESGDHVRIRRAWSLLRLTWTKYRCKSRLLD